MLVAPAYVAGIDQWLRGLAGRSLKEGRLTLERVDGLSGATVTSRAALESINRSAARVLQAAFGGSLPALPERPGAQLDAAFWVTLLSTAVGVCAAFLFEQEDFPLKGPLYFLMLAPLVIPGVILGISILLFANSLGLFFELRWGIDVGLLRPGFWLVVLGQFSFIATLVTLIVAARLRKFDRTLEEAAMNLGAGRAAVIWHITLRFLRPAILGAAAVAFLMSFENFNTTLFLVGSETTLPINLYLQVRDGSTPVINAISFLLIVGTSALAVLNLTLNRRPN